MEARGPRTIVLDLDETLVHTADPDVMPPEGEDAAMLGERLYQFKMPSGENIWGVTRPQIDEFLYYVTTNFPIVIVWSAGERYYVERIVEYIFRGIEHKPLLVFSRDFCELQDGVLTKPLAKLTKLYPVLKLRNMMAIDDRLTTFSDNRDNGLLIQAYFPSTVEEMLENEYVLSSLIEHLDHPLAKRGVI